MNDDIWNSIRFLKKQIGESDQNEMSQGSQQDKKNTALEEYNNQFRKSKLAIKQMKPECNCGKQRAIEIRQLKQEYEEEIKKLKEQHYHELNKQQQNYEEQLQSKEEDLENMHLLINNNNDQDQIMNEIKEQFERQINQERQLFKKQLEKYIEDKLNIEQQLKAKEEEIQQLVSQFQKLDSTREQISQNCASSLFRDTNRKSKIGLKDKSIVEEEMITDSLHCSIKDFNQKVRLMDKSITHEVN